MVVLPKKLLQKLPRNLPRNLLRKLSPKLSPKLLLNNLKKNNILSINLFTMTKYVILLLYSIPIEVATPYDVRE